RQAERDGDDGLARAIDFFRAGARDADGVGRQPHGGAGDRRLPDARDRRPRHPDRTAHRAARGLGDGHVRAVHARLAQRPRHRARRRRRARHRQRLQPRRLALGAGPYRRRGHGHEDGRGPLPDAGALDWRRAEVRGHQSPAVGGVRRGPAARLGGAAERRGRERRARPPAAALRAGRRRLVRRGRAARVGALEYGHPVFEVFRAPRSGDFSSARFYAYRSVTAVPNTQVLARFDAGTPALIERKVGSGHVMLWASTLDLSWSDLPLKPVFLPFLHRSMVHLANYTEPSPWLTIGQVFDPDASSAKAQASGRLALTPSGKRLPLEDEGSSAQVLELTEQGFYEIRGQKANSDVTVVASNVDPAESDLTALDPAEVVTAATTGTAQNGQQVASDIPLTPEAQERSQRLWWYLLATGILLLGVDTLFSNWLSRT